MYSRLNGRVNMLFTHVLMHPETRINKNRNSNESTKISGLRSQAAYEPTLLTSTVQPSPCVNLWTPVTLALFPLFISFSFICNPRCSSKDFHPSFPLSLWLSSSSSSVLPPGSVPSDKGQDAVDEQGHDGSAEQASHGHRDEPRQEDVPEEAPVHCFLGADPAHGHDWAHLEAAARRGERNIISGSTEHKDL